ncbi:hypothetical protein [Cryobacterium sp. TMT2-23]|uniref:hypothetical protein n=1 Tax=Cryobacterium sp. TMT2-23 TaxID=1259252 RepID=UPI00106CB8E3|nr:hypothetical protein [Cryobacterium sp. TMT2-23]TFD15781.1 hypothetical protein E3T32_16265 [Cryobacterium sp. TMT2-23]
MKYKTEAQIMKALEIDSWRNLSRDKVVKFAAMMPQMDKEVQLRIIEKLPEFTSFAREMADIMERGNESTRDFNQRSQDNVYEAWRDVRAILARQLDKEDVSPEERVRIFELLMETANKASQKDSENKKFLAALAKTAALTITVSVLAAVVFVGGQFMLEQQDEDSPADA